jgi:hypothetical protein
LHTLNAKLQEMDLLSLWGEPIDCMNGGPEFFGKLESLLLTKNEEVSAELLGAAIEAMFCLACLSGNQDLILSALDTMVQTQTVHESKADQAFKMTEP